MPPTKHRTARRIHATQPPERPRTGSDNCQPSTDNSSADEREASRPTTNGPARVFVSRDDLISSLRRSIEGAAPEMIDAIIEQGKEGSYLHAKFLFEFAGLNATPAADTSAEQSLAATLLRALALNSDPVATGVSLVREDKTGAPSFAPGQPHRNDPADARRVGGGDNGQRPEANGSVLADDRPEASGPKTDDCVRPNGACKTTAAARA